MLQVVETDTKGGRKPTRSAGLRLAVLTMTISGFAVFLNGYGVRAWADSGGSATYTAIKNVVAASVLLVAYSALARRQTGSTDWRPTRASQWMKLGLVGVIGGSVPFLLFFEGLARASSENAAFIHKTLIIWVALLAVPILKEKVSVWHLGALVLLVVGQTVLVGGLGGLSLGSGELMMLGATQLWAVEVIVVKRLLAELPPATVAVARMGFGAAILVGYGLITGAFHALAGIGVAQWAWVLLTGLVLSAYVSCWYAALARIQAIDVSAVIVGGAVITALLQSGVRGLALPSPVGLAMVALGALMVVARELRTVKVS